MRLHYVTNKHIVQVELIKDGNASVGIVPKGAKKDGKRPIVKSVQFKSVAHRSHCVGTGDVIISICGQDSEGMSKRHVKRILHDKTCIDLELEYELKEARLSTSGVYRFQRMSISMKKEYDSFGFTIRKYGTKLGICSEYPIITNIRSGDSADKGSCLRAGDRLIQIDDQNLSGLPLMEVSDILAEKEEAIFLFEYIVALVDDSCVRIGERSVLEFDYLDSDLGIVLATSAKDASSIFIESILKGSLAERCGAFHVGDVVLCINDIATSHLAASEANALIQSYKKQKGKIIYVPNKEKIQIQREISLPYCETNIKCLKDLSPTTRTVTLDQNQLFPPRNSPASLYNWHLKKTNSILEKSDQNSFDFQTKTITMLQDVIRNISNFEQFIPFLDCDPRQKCDLYKLGSTNVSKKNYGKVDPDRLSQLKAICTETKDSARTIVMHLIKNSINVSVLSGDGKCKSPDYSCHDSYFTRSKMLLELTGNLTEIYTRQLITRQALDSFLKNVSDVDFDCCECYPLCLSAALIVQKIVLLLSLNDQEWDIKFIIDKLVRKAIGIDVPCEDCRTPWCSVSDYGKASPDVKDDTIENQVRSTKNESTVADSISLSLQQTFLGAKALHSPSKTSNGSKDSTSQVSNRTFPKQAQIDLDVSKRSAFYSITQNNCESFESTSNIERVCSSQHEKVQNTNLCVEPGGNSTIPQESPPTEYPEVVENDINNLSKETLKHLLSGRTIAENSTNNCLEKIHTDKGPLSTPNKNWKLEESISRVNEEITPSTKLLSSVNKHSRDPSGCIRKFQLSPVGLVKSSKTLPAKLSPESVLADCLRPKSPLRNSCASSCNETQSKKMQYSTMEIKLKDEGKGFGLEVGMISFRNFPLIPVVLDVKPESAAAKVGIIMKGDRILEINGQSTAGMSVGHLTELTREAFAGESVVLLVEFDVVIPELRYGTFDICFDKSVKPGLEFKDLRKGSPLVVKGVVKGSAAHRSGQLFPGDEILFTNCIRQEAFDSCKCSYQRTDMVLMTVRRKATREENPESEEASPSRSSSIGSTSEEEDPFVVHRTSMHTLADSKDTVLEQHITLFRDRNRLDFGFLVGQNQKTGAMYVTGIRPGGPADRAKVIRKKDRIMEIDGSPVGCGEKSSLSMLLQAGDRLDLVTRRVMSCRKA